MKTTHFRVYNPSDLQKLDTRLRNSQSAIVKTTIIGALGWFLFLVTLAAWRFSYVQTNSHNLVQIVSRGCDDVAR